MKHDGNMKLDEKMGIGILIFLFGAVSLGVIFRYALRLPMAEMVELTRLLFVWVVFIGALVSVRKKAHLKVTILETVLSKRYQLFLEIATNLLSIFFLGYLLISGLDFILKSAIRTRSVIIGYPSIILFGVVPATVVPMIVFLIKFLIADLRKVQTIK